MLLLVSTFIWLNVQFLMDHDDLNRNPDAEPFEFDSMVEKNRRKKSAFEALGQAAAPFTKQKKKKQKGRG